MPGPLGAFAGRWIAWDGLILTGVAVAVAVAATEFSWAVDAARHLDLDAVPRGARHATKHDRVGTVANRQQGDRRTHYPQDLGHLRLCDAAAEAAPHAASKRQPRAASV